MEAEQQSNASLTSIRACRSKAGALLVAVLALGALSCAGLYGGWQLWPVALNEDHEVSSWVPQVFDPTGPSEAGALRGSTPSGETHRPRGPSFLGLEGIEAVSDTRLGAFGPPTLYAIAYGAMPLPQGTAAGSGAQPSVATQPRVRFEAPRVSGRLPPELIRRIVRQNGGRLRLCYEAGLRNNPRLQGQVVVRFVVGRDGRPSNIGASGSLPDGAAVSCVARAFHALSFPEPDGGLVTVSYPVSFTPSS